MHSPRWSGQWTRRSLLAALTAPALLGELDRKRVLPSEWRRYPDPATEFELVRLTDPTYTSLLPSVCNRAISRGNGFLLYASDRPDGVYTGLQVFRMDLSTGQSRRLTEVSGLDPASIALLHGERAFVCFAGDELLQVALTSLHTRELYRVPDGWHRTPGFSVSLHGVYAAFGESNGSGSRLRLLSLAKREVSTVCEAPFELSQPMIRPKRAQICYRDGDKAFWLADFTGQTRKLQTFEGRLGPAFWAPNGRTLLYLNFPDDPAVLNAIREITPDENTDKIVSKTSQFSQFAANGDTSVFVGASRNKASPYLLILVRMARREMAICEHKASDTAITTPMFSPDSQHIYYVSDRDGKPAIYQMKVDKLVEKTKDEDEP